MRKHLVVAALVGLLAALLAQSAAAAPPSTLTDERLFADNTPFTGSGRLTLQCENNTDGTVTIVMDASGASTGPYQGNYDEHAEWTVRWVAGTFQVDLLSLRADFTIRSPAGQVSGTKRLPAPIENSVYPFGSCPSSVGQYMDEIQLDHSATIVSPAGVFADRGTARLTTEPVDIVGGQVTSRFTQTFNSTLAMPEQNESVLFGRRVPGGSLSAMSTNTKRVSPFVLYFPATVRKVYAYVDGLGASSGSQTIRAVLYRRDPADGGPGAYLTRSFEFTVPADMSGRWLPLWVAPIPRLDPGVYWIGIQSGPDHGVARFAWDPKTNARHYNIDPFADGASDPFGQSSRADEEMSIFAAGRY